MGKKKKEESAEQPRIPCRLKTVYFGTIIPALKEQLGRTNVLDLPRLQKITLNMGVGSAVQEKKHLEDAVASMTLIAGQKPAVTKARKSIAGFRLREGMPIGCKATLRGDRMYEFLDRLINIALPRVRDFRGVSDKAFDGQGNYSMGLNEQLVFPELNPDKFLRPQGLSITISISGSSDDESRELLKLFGVPFRSKKQAAA
jgi:large subunit ribosomal protein L5